MKFGEDTDSARPRIYAEILEESKDGTFLVGAEFKGFDQIKDRSPKALAFAIATLLKLAIDSCSTEAYKGSAGSFLLFQSYVHHELMAMYARDDGVEEPKDES